MADLPEGITPKVADIRFEQAESVFRHGTGHFRVGDRVTWTKSHHGIEKQKRGTVIAVVPTGVIPLGHQNARDHESYLVKDDHMMDYPENRHRNREGANLGTYNEPKTYWPQVVKLQRMYDKKSDSAVK